MFTRVRTHIRSNIVGYVALFFSLGLGSAWALAPNSVKSRHIAPNAAKASDVLESSLRLADAVTYVLATSATDSNSPKDLVADCPPDQKVLGGGGSAFDQSNNPVPEITLAHTRPVATKTGWFVEGVEATPIAGNWTIQAHAICAKANG